MRRFKPFLGLMFSAVAIAAAAFPASAQEVWPSRTIRFVTPSPAGVGADSFARLYAENLGKALGVTVIVENKPGAAGTIGTDAVAKSPPDGYTFLLTTSLPVTAAPHLFSKLPYDPRKDLMPVAQLYRGGSFIVANADFPAKSIKDVIALSKQKAESVMYASYGAGSTAHLGMEQLQDATNIRLVQIPYKQSAMPDVISGQVAIGFEPPVSALPNIKTGRIKALAYTGGKRSAALPDVPTLAETVPGLEIYTSVGVYAPKGTPAAIVTRINAALNAATKTTAVAKAIADAGSDAITVSPEQMQKTDDAETESLGRLIKAKNITLN